MAATNCEDYGNQVLLRFGGAAIEAVKHSGPFLRSTSLGCRTVVKKLTWNTGGGLQLRAVDRYDPWNK